MDLSGKYGVGVGVSVTFNVSDLSLFDVDDDSWMDPFKKRVDNMIKTTPKKSIANSNQVNYKIKGKRSSKMHSMSLFRIFRLRWISKRQY